MSMTDGVALMTTTTTGTGALTLSSVTNWPQLQDKVGLNRYFLYGITDSTGAPLAYGMGTLASSSSLTRGAVEDTYSGGTWTENGSPLSLPSGTKNVMLVGLGKFMSQPIPNIQNVAGQRLVLPNGLLPSNQQKTLSANTPIAACLEWNCVKPITSLAAEVITLAGTGSDRIQLGVYACKPDGNPGNLLMRTGDLLPNTTGIKSGTIAGGAGSGILVPGWYWFVICSSVAPVMRAYDAGSDTKAPLLTPMGGNTNLYQRYAFFTCTALSGGWTALPTTITLSGGTIVNGDFCPIIGGIL